MRSRSRFRARPVGASTMRTPTSSSSARWCRGSPGGRWRASSEAVPPPPRVRDTRISKRPGIPAPTLHAYTGERGVYEDSTTWSPSWGIGQGMVMTSTLRDMTKMIRAIGARRLLLEGSPAPVRAPVLQSGCPARPEDRLRARRHVAQRVVPEPAVQRVRRNPRLPAVAADLDRRRKHQWTQGAWRQGHQRRDRQAARRCT